MNVRIINYATPSHLGMQNRLNGQCATYGLDVISYNDEWLRHVEPSGLSLYNQHQCIFDQPRGAGYWLWKPIIIIDAINKFPEDIILYMDSSVMFTEDPNPLLSTITGFAAMQSGYVQKDWTKRDCFYYMDCDEEKYWNAMHLWAGAVFAGKKDEHIIKEWLEYAIRPEILTDAPNICGLDNLPGFVDHRHDQSILTNIVTKYNLPTMCSAIFNDR